jgi:hypothetical protein
MMRVAVTWHGKPSLPERRYNMCAPDKRLSLCSVLLAAASYACVQSATVAQCGQLKRLSDFFLKQKPDDIGCGPTCCSMVLGYYDKRQMRGV